MTPMSNRRRIFIVGLVIAGGLSIALSGCGSKKPKKRSRTLQGVIDQIDVNDGTVTMNSFIDKLGKTIPVTGKIAPETEFYLNGKLVEFSELRVGDDVIVDGFKQGSQVIATRITVLRESDSIDLKKTRQAAATQPAGR